MQTNLGAGPDLLNDEKKHAAFHFNEARFWTRAQWCVMGLLAAAGAITAFSATPAAEGTFVKLPVSILVLGIVTAVGAMANQIGQFSKQIAKHRSRAYFHQGMVTSIESGTLNAQQAGKVIADHFAAVSKAEGS